MTNALIIGILAVQTYLLWKIVGQLRELNKTNERRKEVADLLKGLKTIQLDD